MDTLKGSLVFYVGETKCTLSNIDIIHLYKDKDGSGHINQLFTEDAVENVIKSEIKSRKLQGGLHDISLYTEDDTRIAYAKKYCKEYGNLKFFISKVTL